MGLLEVNYVSEASWKGTKSQQRKIQGQVGRKVLGASRTVASCTVMGELGWRTMTERRENKMISYLGRVRRMDETRLTKKLYEVGIVEDLPRWKDMKEVLRKYTNEEEIDEGTCIPNVKERKERWEQRWAGELQSKKNMYLYTAVKDELKKEEYVDDPRESRGARLKFKFRTRSAGLMAEVGYWKKREESRECVMCSEGENESVEHIMMRCEAYRSERECQWEVLRTESRIEEDWGELEEKKKMEMLLGRDMVREETDWVERCVKSYLRKVMDKR